MTDIVAILNVTPDSFSDGGLHFDPQVAIAAAQRYAEEGAFIIDIGAESTRPGATPLTADDEWQRLEPVVKALSGKLRISIDTRHAETARKALDLGVNWINDVSGFSQAIMVDAVRDAACKLVVMHSVTVPADRHVTLPERADVVSEVMHFARDRLSALESAGIARGRLIFDPGIGFGKTAEQSFSLLRGIEQFQTLGVPILVGHSRKSFLGKKRDEATLTVSQFLATKGIEYLRVHNVAAHRRMLALLGRLHDT